MDATLDDDLRGFEDLLSLLPPTDPWTRRFQHSLNQQLFLLLQPPVVETVAG